MSINAPHFQADPTLLEKYGDGEWRECAAFRFVKEPDGAYRFEVAKTLEEVTKPELCPRCDNGMWTDANGARWKCATCGGTGRAAH